MCGFIGKISFEDFDYKNVIECNDLIECRGPYSLSSHNGKKNCLNYKFIFKHGKRYELSNKLTLIGCYHPSPRNVNTGRINENKMTNLFKKVKDDLNFMN